MAPRTRACKGRNLNHTLGGLNDTSFGDSTHASTVNQVGVEKQPVINLTYCILKITQLVRRILLHQKYIID